MLKRIAFFVYGSLSYLVFLGTFLYALAFVGSLGVPTALDGAPREPLAMALAIDVTLLALFACSTASWRASGSKRGGHDRVSARAQ